jgi:hypothetical protein
VQQIELRIEKPQALAGRASCASVEVTRQRRDYAPQARSIAQHSLTTFLETRHSRLSMLSAEGELELRLPPKTLSRVLALVNKGSIRHGEELIELGQGKVLNLQEPTTHPLMLGNMSEVFLCEEFAGVEETSK